jgi:histidine triad (HIT) family protein
MEDCIFCKIIHHDRPDKFLLETEDLVVLDDIRPAAPVHMLVIPKLHIPSAHHLTMDNTQLLADMFAAARKMADERGIGDRGYKLVFNVGKEGGQVVNHLHLHILGGKQLHE